LNYAATFKIIITKILYQFRLCETWHHGKLEHDVSVCLFTS